MEVMKRKPLKKRRLGFEGLEGRLVLSAVPGLHAVGVGGNSHLATVASTTSTNWSGYAVQSTAKSVSTVTGSWVVPSVTGSGTSYSSDWVGIDGYNSSTVEQIGTDSDLVNGHAVYYAWYEVYPQWSVQIPTSQMSIMAGDAMTASVQYVSGNNFLLTITDTTRNETFSTTQSAPGAARSSAEWVVEAPSSNSGVLPLANFGTASFTAASATINGATGSIGSFSQVAKINMVSGYGSVEASTSTLNPSSGVAFSVAYQPTTTVAPTPHHRHSRFQTEVPAPAAASQTSGFSWGLHDSTRLQDIRDRVFALPEPFSLLPELV
jgi:hypothetical protein